MEEFTGEYYHCEDCNHLWDYNDSHCPNCGSENFGDLNANEVKEKANQMINEGKSALAMLKVHDDL